MAIRLPSLLLLLLLMVVWIDEGRREEGGGVAASRDVVIWWVFGVAVIAIIVQVRVDSDDGGVGRRREWESHGDDELASDI